MKHTFNYTGRVRMTRDMFDIAVHETTEGFCDVEVKLFLLSINGQPGIGPLRTFVEAYTKHKTVRLEMGKGSLHDVSHDRFSTSFPNGSRLLFRIKVVSAQERLHKIVASCDQVMPVTYDASNQKKSLLVIQSRNLGDLPWKLDLEFPYTLLLNERLVPANNLSLEDFVKQDMTFATFVMPEVFRQILLNLKKTTTAEDVQNNGWALWMNKFIDSPDEFWSIDSTEPDSDDSIKDQIESAVDRYCADKKFLERFNEEGANAQ